MFLYFNARHKMNNRNFFKCGFIIILGLFFLFGTLKVFYLPGDEHYQALSVRYYKESPLAMLVFYIGNIWTSVFGDSMLDLRILCKLCVLISIVIGCQFLYSKTHNLLLTSYIFALCCICNSISGFAIYNWDNGAFPFEALGLVSLIIYIRKHSLLYIIITGFITGLMTAARVPLVVFVVICIWIIIHQKNKNLSSTISHTSAYLLAFILSLICCAELMTGSLTSYVASFNKDNIITGHSPSDINIWIWRIKYFLPLSILNTMPAVICFFLSHYYTNVRYHRNLIYCIIIFLMVFLYWCLMRFIAIGGEDYITTLSNIGLPLFLIPLIVIPCKSLTQVKSRKLIDFNLRTNLIVLLLFMFLLGFGSDTWFQRWSIVFIFPICLGVIWEYLDTKLKHVMKTWFSLMFIILIIFGSIRLCYIYIKDIDIKNSSTTLSSMKGLPHLYNYEKMWSEPISEIEQLKHNNKNFTFWGPTANIFHYNYNSYPKFSHHLFHVDDESYSLLLENKDSIDNVFILWYDDNRLDNTIKVLQNNNFYIKSEGKNYALMSRFN